MTRVTEDIDGSTEVEELIDHLDSRKGVVLTSTFEYPGRYTRWDMGFVDPALQITTRGRSVVVESLNSRGAVILPALARWLEATLLEQRVITGFSSTDNAVAFDVVEWSRAFPEEQRTRQPSVFSALREILAFFKADDDAHLGLYGAFGYDLAFQFEPVAQHQLREADQRDLVLFVPDELVIVDHQKGTAVRHRYDFAFGDASSIGSDRALVEGTPYEVRLGVERSGDHVPGEYAASVEKAKQAFRRGDLFEVVPGQTFFESSPVAPSVLFRRLRERNPAPYGALMNLGDDEYLVAASPEMYVRVEGRRVETCPISGTIARGEDVFGDAAAIVELLNSEKDASELTMCTDVDRNDKSRVCEPESIRVIGRRQIEMYSRLIHTVDHVEGRLRPEFDALDAFLAHTWAVTVTGAPKLWAMRFIEENEKTARAWYGGAIGALLFNGNCNTGLTLRTIRVKDGVAYVRAGATLLIDSDPEAEERETETKASALLDAIRYDVAKTAAVYDQRQTGAGLKVLLVDHEDSFVHTLAGYLRRTGADVTTWRVPVGTEFDAAVLDQLQPDLVVVSPGPGSPKDFNMDKTLAAITDRSLPAFGVCLGLQAMVEHFGGELSVLDHPAHGKSSPVEVKGGWLFADLPERFSAGRYHSLYANRSTFPDTLNITAETEDGVVMAVEHVTLPIAAVQFHPESLMTMQGELGMRIIDSMMNKVRSFNAAR